MGTAAQPQPGYEASAIAIIRNAVVNPDFRRLFAPALTNEGQQVLAASGITAPEHYDELLRIINLLATGMALQNPITKEIQEQTLQQQVETARQQVEMNRIQLEQQKEQLATYKASFDDTMRVATSMKYGLMKTMDSISKAFENTKWMYMILFGVGLLLILFAVVFPFTATGKGKDLLSVVFGGFGTANTLAFFFTRPPERLESSRAGLAQLQCALLNWFVDLMNKNSLMLEVKSNPNFKLEPYGQLSDELMKHTKEMMDMLQQYCKLVESPPAPKEKLRDKLTKGGRKQQDPALEAAAAKSKKALEHSEPEAEASAKPAA